MSHDVTRLLAKQVDDVTSRCLSKKITVTEQAKKSSVFMKPMIHYHRCSCTP